MLSPDAVEFEAEAEPEPDADDEDEEPPQAARENAITAAKVIPINLFFIVKSPSLFKINSYN